MEYKIKINYLRNYLRNYLIIFLYIFIRKMAKNSNVHMDIKMVYIIIVALAIMVVIYMMTNKSHTSQRPIVVSAPQGNCQNMLDMCQSKLMKCNTKFGDSVEKFSNMERFQSDSPGLRVLSPPNAIYGGYKNKGDKTSINIYMEKTYVKECTNLYTGINKKNPNLLLIAKYNGPRLVYNCQYGKVQAVMNLLKTGKDKKYITIATSVKDEREEIISKKFNLLFNSDNNKIQVPPTPSDGTASTKNMTSPNMTILQLYDTLITYTNIVPFYLLDKNDLIISIGDCGLSFPYSPSDQSDSDIKSIVFKFIDLKYIDSSVKASKYLGTPNCENELVTATW